MSSSVEETYTTMFSSLRHPSRRKILKMLSERPMTFSEILEELGIPGSHLTYHLENLREFLDKTQDGKYKLSSAGEGAVSIMKGAEEVPNVLAKKFSSFSLKWKSVFAALMICVVALGGISGVEYAFLSQVNADLEKALLQNQQILSWDSAERAMIIIRDVARIDTTKYQTTLLSNTVENRSYLGGVVEQILRYSLKSEESNLDLLLRFRNNHFSLYQLSLVEGIPPFSPVYIEPQSTDILEAARNLIQRYKSSSDEPHLEEMSQLLASVNVTDDEATLGNIRLKMTIYGDTAEILLMYTVNEFAFSAKSIRLLFQNNILKEISDDWFLFSVSDEIFVSKEEAIQIALNAAKDFEWTADGVTVSDFSVRAERVSAVFFPHPRSGGMTLIPYWYITLYLDKEYPGGVNGITVGVWADTGEVANIQTLSS